MKIKSHNSIANKINSRIIKNKNFIKFPTNDITFLGKIKWAAGYIGTLLKVVINHLIENC